MALKKFREKVGMAIETVKNTGDYVRSNIDFEKRVKEGEALTGGRLGEYSDKKDEIEKMRRIGKAMIKNGVGEMGSGIAGHYEHIDLRPAVGLLKGAFGLFYLGMVSAKNMYYGLKYGKGLDQEVTKRVMANNPFFAKNVMEGLEARMGSKEFQENVLNKAMSGISERVGQGGEKNMLVPVKIKMKR